jgi:hypothetical protein
MVQLWAISRSQVADLLIVLIIFVEPEIIEDDEVVCISMAHH